ncbi:MAG: ZIP family metal transporter [Candidatus Micrarchaeaceae archaeon]
MINTYLTVGLSFLIGLFIFVSMPIVFHRTTGIRRMLFFNAFAIGILAFLLLVIFGDVAAIFGSSTITSPLVLIFLAGFVAAFLFFTIPKASRDPEENPKRTSVLAGMGIGFQNLTEGLVFGSAGAAGLLPIYVLSIIGFGLQNMTEGFPIAAPLVGLKKKVEKRFIAGVFVLGGAPVVIGTLIGLVFYSNAFIVFFDALACAAILYVVLVLFHININRGSSDQHGIKSSMKLTYSGILLGFVVAYVVNYAVVA